MSDINGTNANDILAGTADEDTIDGKTGADVMKGGGKNDKYYVDNVNDKVLEYAGGGVDTVFSTVSITKLWEEVENLTLIGNALNGTGNANSNLITGNEKANVLDGGASSDALIGGKGNDTYIVDDKNDSVIEQDGEGVDLIKASIDYTASAWVENVTLTGKADLHVYGNMLDNVLTGNDGNNYLYGAGGADTMKGGKGNDQYVVEDAAADKVVELASQGIDEIIATVDYSLADAANVENLTLDGKVATGIGNALNNLIKGNNADNTIDGGKGADEMQGGAGDDTYYVDNAKDKVVEIAGKGMSDLVFASVSVTQLWDQVENLTLTGNGAINATGNALDNYIVGNGAKNIIDGGLGADIMVGKGGNDIYIVDNAGDKTVEADGEGIDLVKSSVGYKLADFVEKLSLTSVNNIWGTGNDLDNTLTGNDGDNTLDGGLGKDTMIGGKGGDSYIVDNVGDKVMETVSNANGGGHDAVYSSVNFSLAGLANVEDLILTGNAEKATGNALDNVIDGTSIGNYIDGGKGADIMSGFDGWDVYYVDNAGDIVVEAAGQGKDLVVSTVALANGFAEVESYEFATGVGVKFNANELDNNVFGGSGKDEFYGLNGNDSLFGNAGNDKLFGGLGNDRLEGGAGADEMTGGSGNDSYFIENVNDKVFEGFAGGNDFVQSTVSIAQLFDFVEGAELWGSGNINLTGNSLGNLLQGNTGNNVINGAAGKDTIAGGNGNDTLTGGTEADTFQFGLTPHDAANEGKDKITDFMKAEDVLQFYGVADENNDGMTDLADLLLSISSVVDKGAGKDVEVSFDNGAVITFAGVGTGAVDSIVDLVGTTAQIEVIV